jgi:drug/metabolite transporter (DMT)-like permease
MTLAVGRGSRAGARLMLATAALCFGLMAVLARKLTLPGLGFTAGHLSALRFALGIALGLAAFRIWPDLYRPNNYRLLITRGISGGLVVVLYFYGLAHIPAGEAGIIYNLFPVIATVISLFLFKDRPTPSLFLGILAATAGVGLVLSQGRLALHFGAGELAVLAAAVFAATSANAIRAARPTENAATIFFFFSLIGLPVVLPFALAPWPSGLWPWALALAMSLLSIAGQVLMAEAYGPLTVAEAAVWLQLIPVTQYFLAVPVLGEPVTTVGLAGVALTVAGVVLGTVLGKRKP